MRIVLLLLLLLLYSLLLLLLLLGREPRLGPGGSKRPQIGIECTARPVVHLSFLYPFFFFVFVFVNVRFFRDVLYTYFYIMSLPSYS